MGGNSVLSKLGMKYKHPTLSKASLLSQVKYYRQLISVNFHVTSSTKDTHARTCTQVLKHALLAQEMTWCFTSQKWKKRKTTLDLLESCCSFSCIRVGWGALRKFTDKRLEVPCCHNPQEQESSVKLSESHSPHQIDVDKNHLLHLPTNPGFLLTLCPPCAFSRILPFP